nr:MAG TPA: hypothetical protein [Caudoviricetes sp.]
MREVFFICFLKKIIFPNLSQIAPASSQVDIFESLSYLDKMTLALEIEHFQRKER